MQLAELYNIYIVDGNMPEGEWWGKHAIARRVYNCRDVSRQTAVHRAVSTPRGTPWTQNS
jgi:hypothetical protein